MKSYLFSVKNNPFTPSLSMIWEEVSLCKDFAKSIKKNEVI
jgi:hypothetical protein